MGQGFGASPIETVEAREGKTASELQSPAGNTDIYENWNVDLDEEGVGDGLWDFGNASQYPPLRHGS